MSLRETPMVRRYWRHVGGTIAEEFPAVRPSKTASVRRLDAVIVPGGEPARVPWRELDVAGRDIIVVQAKLGRLGMNVMGQALFSRELMKPFGPASVRTVAIVVRDDSVLRPLAEAFGIEVVIDPLGGSVDREPDAGTAVPREAGGPQVGPGPALIRRVSQSRIRLRALVSAIISTVTSPSLCAQRESACGGKSK